MAAEAAFWVHHRHREHTTFVACCALEDALAHTAYPAPSKAYRFKELMALANQAGKLSDAWTRSRMRAIEDMAMRLRDSSQATDRAVKPCTTRVCGTRSEAVGTHYTPVRIRTQARMRSGYKDKRTSLRL
uniref:Uncharacterized protein n=1 Tax=Ralstonia solanacearum TaxID=305 RepID=A0A0S4TQ23_RALSL|nr:protein of unknown function [Ralstonia solanacearum]